MSGYGRQSHPDQIIRCIAYSLIFHRGADGRRAAIAQQFDLAIHDVIGDDTEIQLILLVITQTFGPDGPIHGADHQHGLDQLAREFMQDLYDINGW